jgi:hypothetical protein
MTMRETGCEFRDKRYGIRATGYEFRDASNEIRDARRGIRVSGYEFRDTRYRASRITHHASRIPHRTSQTVLLVSGLAIAHSGTSMGLRDPCAEWAQAGVNTSFTRFTLIFRVCFSA